MSKNRIEKLEKRVVLTTSKFKSSNEDRAAHKMQKRAQRKLAVALSVQKRHAEANSKS